MTTPTTTTTSTTTTTEHIGPHGNQPVTYVGPGVGEADAVLLLVHGRGGSAADMLRLGAIIATPTTAMVAPQAADNTWYPQSFLVPREQNEPYVTSALAAIKSVAAGLPAERTILVGFSQGACLASQFLLENGGKFGGAALLTGGVIGEQAPAAPPPGISLDNTPIFLASGDPDPHIPWSRVAETAALLTAMGADVTVKRYPGRPHTVTTEELNHVQAMLGKVSGQSPR